MPTGAEIFIDTVVKLGIDRVFTLVGDHLNAVLAVAAKRGLEVVHMRHEAAVVHAADGWSRMTRKPALSLVTGGPGHTNSLTGIATANANGSPVICVSGATAIDLQRRVAFQDIDQAAMAAPATKWSHAVGSVEQISFALGNAYAEASAGRMGATHLTIPVNLFTGSAAQPLPVPRAAATPPGPRHTDVVSTLEALRTAERPVVIGGSGLWWSGAGNVLKRFLAATRLPYFDVTMARGVLSEETEGHMGYADPSLNRAAVEAFKSADVVLVLGKRIDYRISMGTARLFSPEARFLQVDIHAQELGHNRDLSVGICADVKETLEAMQALIGKTRWAASPWLRALRKSRDAWRRSLMALAEERSGDKLLHPASFYAEVMRTLPVSPLLCWDGGDFIHWGRAMMPARHSGGWLRLGPMATIGAALPFSLSQQMARPEQPVMLSTGDGSLGFYIAELDTAVRYQLPVVMLVGNDAGWGLERELQGATEGTDVACELRRTRYDLVMKGFGGGGENISTLQQVGPALGRAFASRRPYLLNVNIKGARSPFTEWQLSGKKR